MSSVLSSKQDMQVLESFLIFNKCMYFPLFFHVYLT